MRQPFAKCLAGHRKAIEMQQVFQFTHQGAHAAGSEEVLHVAVADRLQVHQHRRGVGQFVELLQRHEQAGAACDRGQMDDRIGGAADGQQDPQGVLDGFLIHDFVGRKLRADQPHRGLAGCFRRTQAVRMHGWNRGRARQDHAERLHEARGLNRRAAEGVQHLRW